MISLLSPYQYQFYILGRGVQRHCPYLTPNLDWESNLGYLHNSDAWYPLHYRVQTTTTLCGKHYTVGFKPEQRCLLTVTLCGLQKLVTDIENFRNKIN